MNNPPSSRCYSKPTRVQRSRKKGWKMPLNTIYVGRGSKWGNPLRVMGDMIYIDAGYRRKVFSKWFYLCFGDASKCVQIYKFIVTGIMGSGKLGVSLKDEPDILYWANYFSKLNFKELKGKNLSCWCKHSEPCHSDVLLELANKKQT